MITARKSVIFRVMNMHASIKATALGSAKARRQAADRAIAIARKMKSNHVGFASDQLVAERRAEFWLEEAKTIRLHG